MARSPLRSDLRQLLSRLQPEAGYVAIIELDRDPLVLKFLEPGDLVFLAVDITGVFQSDLDLFDDI